MQKLLFIVLLSSIVFTGVSTQGATRISIRQCQDWARENYPLIKQFGLMEKSKEYSLSNVSKGYLPQFSVNAQATYQSDVTSLGIKLPGFEIDKISKDQYRVYGELNQILYDGGIIKNKKESIKTEKEADVAFMEVKLYQLKNQIEELFFGILVLNKKLDQNIIYQKDL